MGVDLFFQENYTSRCQTRPCQPQLKFSYVVQRRTVSLKILESKSKFDENCHCYSLMQIYPITMKFCTYQYRKAVLVNAKFHCEKIFQYERTYETYFSHGLCNESIYHHIQSLNTWWRHQMETFSALLAICAGNSPVPGEFPSQRPVTRSFDVFFDLCLNK